MRLPAKQSACVIKIRHLALRRALYNIEHAAPRTAVDPRGFLPPDRMRHAAGTKRAFRAAPVLELCCLLLFPHHECALFLVLP